ncbi:hypothetical protein HPP92_005623 [Vanilla planifolia]|uniref:Uncharacterized protein n=1 Tax=Vanilla planifolia TaxID=51239 RepID=A0A835RN17_VANPL|nr:hypothetical protein HPP92_005623 [Vanilla planifolia]
MYKMGKPIRESRILDSMELLYVAGTKLQSSNISCLNGKPGVEMVTKGTNGGLLCSDTTKDLKFSNLTNQKVGEARAQSEDVSFFRVDRGLDERVGGSHEQRVALLGGY